MKFAIVKLMLMATLSGCAIFSLGEMLPGEIVSLSDGTILPMEIEIIRASDVNGKIIAHNPITGENFHGKYSAILEKNVEFGFMSSTATANSRGGGSATGYGSGHGTETSSSNVADAIAVLIGDKGTVLNIKMRIQAGMLKSQIHGYGEAEDNKGNRYQVRF